MKNLKQQLKNLNIKNLKTENGKTVMQELKNHAEILKDCIYKELETVYHSYSPKVYNRTYDLLNSLQIGEVKTQNNTIQISVFFDDSAIHTGIFGDPANTSVLLNEGWTTHGNFADVPYFGYRDATHFIERGIEKYRQMVKNPFDVQFEIRSVN